LNIRRWLICGEIASNVSIGDKFKICRKSNHNFDEKEPAEEGRTLRQHYCTAEVEKDNLVDNQCLQDLDIVALGTQLVEVV